MAPAWATGALGSAERAVLVPAKLAEQAQNALAGLRRPWFAGGTIAAVSVDYPGSLLDVRHRVDEELHEVERGLSLAATLGYRLPEGDDGGLRVRLRGSSDAPELERPYVVVHPGASVPARAWAPQRHAELVEALGMKRGDSYLEVVDRNARAQFALVVELLHDRVEARIGHAHLPRSGAELLTGTPVPSFSRTPRIGSGHDHANRP